MKRPIKLFFLMLLWQQTTAQTTLFSESFETDGEGTRYFSNTFSFCSGVPGNNPDYFLRTNSNPVLPAGCTIGFTDALTNLQGSFFWASEDVRSSSPVLNANPPGQITTKVINTTNYSALMVSLYLATSSNNNVRWETSDSINIQASFDGVNYATVGRFMGDLTFGGRLRIDGNLDGAITAADPATTCDQLNFAKYTFTIPGTGPSLRIRIDYDQIGGTEELGLDLIEVSGLFTLPVKLNYFQVQKTAPNSALLFWELATPSSVAGMELEKSPDGRNFTGIQHFVPGNLARFQFTDSLRNNGNAFYRLQFKEYTGETSYSQVLSVANRSAQSTFGISPNPAKQQTRLFYYSSTNEQTQLKILDINGRQVYKTQWAVVKGLNHFRLETAAFPKGIYFISLIKQPGSNRFTEKLIVE